MHISYHRWTGMTRLTYAERDVTIGYVNIELTEILGGVSWIMGYSQESK